MKSQWRAHAALLAMVVIWGLNFSITKVALAELSPLAFNAIRFPMAAVLLAVLLRLRGELRLPARSEMPRVITIGVLGNMVYQLFFIVGLDHTAPGNASMLLAGTPIITAFLSTLLGHERPRWTTWFGVFCTFVGIALIVFSSAQMTTSKGGLLGDFLMFGASILWAFYTVASRNLVDRHGPVLVTAWTLWVGTIGLFVCGIPDLLKTNWSNVSAGSWAAVLYAGILSIGVAYVIWYYGVDRLGNTRTSIYSNITPVVAVLSAWLFLGEVPRTLQLIGAAIIIAGVTIAQTVSLRASPEG